MNRSLGINQLPDALGANVRAFHRQERNRYGLVSACVDWAQCILSWTQLPGDGYGGMIVEHYSTEAVAAYFARGRGGGLSTRQDQPQDFSLDLRRQRRQVLTTRPRESFAGDQPATRGILIGGPVGGIRNFTDRRQKPLQPVSLTRARVFGRGFPPRSCRGMGSISLERSTRLEHVADPRTNSRNSGF